MRWLPILALLMGLSGGAQAFTLFEIESNDCHCEATPGGTAQTTLLQGTLSDIIFSRDEIYVDVEDYYRFEFSEPVPYFSARPASPNIAGDDSYREFDLGLFQTVTIEGEEFPDLISLCRDCWFYAGAVEAYDLPAGTYYIGVADFGIGPANTQEEPPSQSRGLGAYSVAISTSVPEPASLALFGTALAGLALRRRRA